MDYSKIFTSIKDYSIPQILGVILILYLPQLISMFKKKKSTDDLTHIIDRSVNRAIKIFTIKEITTINEQMDVVDRTSIKVRNVYMNGYKSLLDFNQSDSKRDLRAYTNILDITLDKMRVLIKKWIKRNHLLEMTDKEFLTYVQDTSKDLLIEIENIFDKEYYSEDFIVNRHIVKTNNNDNEIRTLLQDCLYNIREVAKDKAVEISKLGEKNE